MGKSPPLYLLTVRNNEEARPDQVEDEVEDLVMVSTIK